ncbi:MAG: DedA family protein [Prevotellaceae bacterium]|jgi:membrane protein YqaA with SNARE-associated domain|nr:DedA family protein [Prevotellaceae bacterium]
MIKRLYNWVLSWADSKWGCPVLFAVAFAESSFFPVPPDVLLIALCLGNTKKAFRFSLICMAGSVMGAMLGYTLGMYAWQGVQGWFIPSVFSQESFNAVAAAYEKWNFWAVFTAGFTPLPYKIFTITAGVCHINFLMFILASVVGRSLRFFLVGGLIWKFGAPVKVFIDKYFNLLAVAFTVILIGSFVLLKYIL